MRRPGRADLGCAGLLHPKLPHSSTVSLHDLVGAALQLVFTSVAGQAPSSRWSWRIGGSGKSVTPSYGLLPPIRSEERRVGKECA